MVKPSIGSVVLQGAADLFPGYFALVMATGIVSIASYLLGVKWAAIALLRINEAAYLVLWLFLALRLARFAPRVLVDLSEPSRGAGFFTTIAATCVLGTQMVIEAGDYGAATVLFVVGTCLWCATIYSFFPAVMVRKNKPGLDEGITGAWLIATVGTQSISILGTLISPQFGGSREALLFFALAMYLVGGLLYLVVITLIFYRLTFFDLTGAAFAPPHWIDMGAAAITTLAGATLMLNASQWALLQEILPFLTGFTLFFWAAGTWWIPILFILNGWRHLVVRYPVRYDPQYWSMVFPLGMYTVCTFQLSRTGELDFLILIPQVFIYLAWAAWVVVFAGMVYHLVSRMAAAFAPLKSEPRD